MRTHFPFGLSACAALTLLAFAGCGIVVGIEDRSAVQSNLADAQGIDAEPGDTSVEAIVEASAEASEPVDTAQELAEDAVAQDAACSLRPPAAHGNDPSDGGNLDLVFAVHDLDFGAENEGWQKLGFDLDETDTTPGAGASRCKYTGEPGTTPPSAWYDNPCAVDNSTGGILWDMVAPIISDLKTSIMATSGEFQLGKKGLLFRIQLYNGMLNDNSVVVSVLETSGTQAPEWHGTDVWTVNAQSLATQKPPISKYLDSYAYVANGVLVARLDTFPIRMSAGNVTPTLLPLEQALLTARLELDSVGGNHKLLGGRLGGSFRPPSLFRMASMSNASCVDTETVKMLKDGACPYLDMRVPKSSNPDDPCNGFSMGLAFEAWRATTGMVVDVPDPVDPCPAIDCP